MLLRSLFSPTLLIACGLVVAQSLVTGNDIAAEARFGAVDAPRPEAAATGRGTAAGDRAGRARIASLAAAQAEKDAAVEIVTLPQRVRPRVAQATPAPVDPPDAPAAAAAMPTAPALAATPPLAPVPVPVAALRLR